MAKVGAQRAAVLTGRSKSTVQRAMNSGKLSYALDQNQRRVIDVSELERVFGIKQQSLQQPAPTQTIESPASAIEKERMTMQIKMLEQQVMTANEYIDDLKDQRDKWEKQASQVLITSQYSQKQADDLRIQIKERDEKARQRRLQHAQMQNAQIKGRTKTDAPSQSSEVKKLDNKMKKLKAENENSSENAGSVFRFWKKARG